MTKKAIIKELKFFVEKANQYNITWYRNTEGEIVGGVVTPKNLEIFYFKIEDRKIFIVKNYSEIKHLTH